MVGLTIVVVTSDSAAISRAVGAACLVLARLVVLASRSAPCRARDRSERYDDRSVNSGRHIFEGSVDSGPTMPSSAVIAPGNAEDHPSQIVR